jgi:hypothetical protein
MSENARGASWWSRVFGADGGGDVQGEIDDAATPQETANELAMRLSAMAEDHAALETRFEQLRVVYEMVRDELTAERAAAATRKAMLEEARVLEETVRTLEDEKQGLSKQLRAKTTRIGELEAELARRNGAWGALERRASTAERSATTIRRGAESTRRKLEEEQALCQDLRAQLETAARIREEQVRSLEAAALRGRELEREVARLGERLQAEADGHDRERTEASGRLEIVRERLIKMEAANHDLERAVDHERTLLRATRTLARRFLLAAVDALQQCVGRRAHLPLRRAWRRVQFPGADDLATAVDELVEGLEGSGWCSHVSVDARGDHVCVDLVVASELRALCSSPGLPTWLVEYVLACLATVDPRVREPLSMSADFEQGLVRAEIGPAATGR